MTPNSPSWERLYDHGPSHRRPSSCSRSVPKTPDLVLLCLGIGSRSETVDQDQLGVGAGLPGLQPGLALGRLVECLRRPAGLSGYGQPFPGVGGVGQLRLDGGGRVVDHPDVGHVVPRSPIPVR